jgi:hypothetical protein
MKFGRKNAVSGTFDSWETPLDTSQGDQGLGHTLLEEQHAHVLFFYTSKSGITVQLLESTIRAKEVREDSA